MKKSAFLLSFLAIFCLPAASWSVQDAKTKAEETVKSLLSAWIRAAANKDVDKYLAYYSEDAQILGPRMLPIETQPDRREFVTQMMGLPGWKMVLEPKKVEASADGTLVYCYGRYEVTLQGPEGSPRADRGKTVSIWRKVSDGNYRCAIDIWNADPIKS